MRLLFLLCILSCAQLSTAQNITITVDTDIPAGQTLSPDMDVDNYLIQNLIDYKIDTVKVKNGKITIKNKTTMITPFALARNTPRQFTIFFVEPKKEFNLTISEPTFTIKSVKGSNAQQEYLDFMKKQEALQAASQQIQAALPQSTNQDSLRNILTYNQMQMNAQYIDFILFEKDNNLGAYMVFDIANKNQGMGAADLTELYDKLSEKGKNTFLGKKVAERINRLKAMDVGNLAPDFALKDKNGKPHTLSKLRGKYVLIDFWASWCGPCIKEIPHLKEAYEKFHSKGFEIVSVSIDREKDKWLQSMEKYQLPWISIIDNEKEEEKITQTLYYVPTIPRTVLLDKNGVVIGKDYRGEALEEKLSSLLN